MRKKKFLAPYVTNVTTRRGNGMKCRSHRRIGKGAELFLVPWSSSNSTASVRPISLRTDFFLCSEGGAPRFNMIICIGLAQNEVTASPSFVFCVLCLSIRPSNAH